jgi:hypothetical protein
LDSRGERPPRDSPWDAGSHASVTPFAVHQFLPASRAPNPRRFLPAPGRVPSWHLIQSDFGGTHGNFEAVILQGKSLVHWWRDNSDPALPWKRGQIIVQEGAAAAGNIIQSDFGSGSHGNFEVVVPLFAADGTLELWHFWHDNSEVNLPWQRGQRIATKVAGPASIIQSDFRSGSHGNFEVVVPVVAAAGTIDLWHFWHDNSDVNLPWQRGQRIAANVNGPATIIQSDFLIRLPTRIIHESPSNPSRKKRFSSPPPKSS